MWVFGLSHKVLSRSHNNLLDITKVPVCMIIFPRILFIDSDFGTGLYHTVSHFQTLAQDKSQGYFDFHLIVKKM